LLDENGSRQGGLSKRDDSEIRSSIAWRCHRGHRALQGPDPHERNASGLPGPRIAGPAALTGKRAGVRLKLGLQGDPSFQLGEPGRARGRDVHSEALAVRDPSLERRAGARGLLVQEHVEGAPGRHGGIQPAQERR
jgi:hypothetical protein